MTERVLHWVHAAAFFGMLGTGLVLYLPALAAHIGSRPVVKAIHLAVAVGWLTALAMVAIAGDRRALRAARRQIERFDDDDLLWLRGRPTPQGRFNAGQKVHAIIQAALGVLFTVSGVLLWLGERNTTLRLPGTIALHDVATFIAAALVLGHLYLSLISPVTRPALRGITRGTVRADWARAHHGRWIPGPGRPRFPVSRRSVAAAALVALVGVATATALVLDILDKRTTAAQAATAPPRRSTAPPPTRNALALVAQAQQLDSTGRLADAIPLYERAAAALPRRADLREALGFALVRTGNLAPGTRELRAAVRLDPRSAQTHLLLGAALLRDGHRPDGQHELRRSLALSPHGPGADVARRLLRSPHR